MADMGSINLLPGTPTPPQFPLARYHPFQLSGVVREFVESATQHGDVALVAGAMNGATISDIVEAGRRVAGVVRNPIDQLRTSLQIRQIPTHDLQVAITQLADQNKSGRPFWLHVRDLYKSNCPRCQRPGTAEWFAWDRESGRPFAKRVRCTSCDTSVEGPVTAQDVEIAGQFPITLGPAYHLALSRVKAPNTSYDPRLAQLIQIYTSRNLAVLMDIISRLPRLRTGPEVSLAMTGLLLEAFDQGSSLVSYEAPDEKPRSLRPPQRFLERNIWMILEAAAHAYAEMRGEPKLQGLQHNALPSLLARPQSGYLLLNRSVQGLDPEGLAAAFQALIITLTPPDAVYWALSTLWATWLWGDEVPSGLRGFLSRRRLDWEWYRRSLAVALDHVRPVLAPDAPVLVLAECHDTAATRAVVHAAAASGLDIERWLICPPHGIRLLARFGDPAQVRRRIAEQPDPVTPPNVIEHLLQQRGEPVEIDDLTTAAILHTRNHDFPRIPGNAAEATNVAIIGDTHLWLNSGDRAALPLADRVEDALLQTLTHSRAHQRLDLVRELYATFNGICTPAQETVDAIIHAYTIQNADGSLSLRAEDDPKRRNNEMQRLRSALQRLGEQLGYRVAKRLNKDLIWRDKQRIAYIFRFSATAILGPHLLRSQPPCDGKRCLITPGGRAALIALKLRRDPHLQTLAETHHWTFIKFRHVRRMIEEITQRREIEVYLGLDPIVEHPGAQIPLPLDINTR